MPVHQVWSILDKYTEQTRALNDDVTLFVDLERKKTIFVAEGKDNATVKAFVADLAQHKGNTSNITDVSCDMSPAFIKGVKDKLPEAKITFDKFHIIKILNEAVGQVRRMAVKENPLLKGTRYIFLKNDTSLTQTQRDKKAALQLSTLNIKLFRALRLRETFQ